MRQVRFTDLSVQLSLCQHTFHFVSTCLPVCLTGVNIWTLSVKLPMKVMIDMRWLSLSMRLNCIMNRSSSLRASRGFLSLSYCRRSFTSASVGRKRIRHSTKSTRTVRRSNLQKHKPVTGNHLNLKQNFKYRPSTVTNTSVWTPQVASQQPEHTGVMDSPDGPNGINDTTESALVHRSDSRCRHWTKAGQSAADWSWL